MKTAEGSGDGDVTYEEMEHVIDEHLLGAVHPDEIGGEELTGDDAILVEEDEEAVEVVGFDDGLVADDGGLEGEGGLSYAKPTSGTLGKAYKSSKSGKKP